MSKAQRLASRERKLRKRLRGFKRKAAKRGTVIVSYDGGPPCPECRKSGEIDEHEQITDKHLRQTSYFTRFFRCRNPDCHVTLYYEERYRVWNKPPVTNPVTVTPPMSEPIPMITVVQLEDGWIVANSGKQIAGPFQSNADAWRWIDRHQGDPISRSEHVSQWISEKA